MTDSTFTSADRCDVCGARAWVKATFTHGDLLFCAHHARTMDEALTAASHVVDARDGQFAQAR